MLSGVQESVQEESGNSVNHIFGQVAFSFRTENVVEIQYRTKVRGIQSPADFFTIKPCDSRVF